MKRGWRDLAVFGGEPEFADKLYVGRPDSTSTREVRMDALAPTLLAKKTGAECFDPGYGCRRGISVGRRSFFPRRWRSQFPPVVSHCRRVGRVTIRAFLADARRRGSGEHLSAFINSAAAVHELLGRSPRRLMQFLRAFFDAKSSTKLFVQRLSVISHHIQAAALGGALRSKGTHDDMAAQFHCICD